ncbi:hypothetical protein PHPALM_31165 [Phytophthora palmivora]|uniref:Uncharacterized protein n=1 Tax=Phytophthora palmivora TaxID=4796 RepID=A0A2P4X393_9STRA|nr:hypothetical protein PHPALM_31165 [Phytophthora palmivora]
MENAVDCGLGEDRAYSNPGEEEEYATASDADEDGSSSSASLLESDSEVIPPDVDDAVAEHIDSVLGVWCCQHECLSKQSEGVTAFIAAYMKMSKDGQRTSLVTALSVSPGLSVEGQRHRSTGQRVRYAYCLPFSGEVCRTAFQTAYNISNDTLNRYRKQIQQNLYAIPQHGNTGNRNAKFVDEVPLKAFFTRLAELERLCPTIRIQSPRDNVCDACVIYRNTMGPEPTVEDTEVVASHIADAK